MEPIKVSNVAPIAKYVTQWAHNDEYARLAAIHTLMEFRANEEPEYIFGLRWWKSGFGKQIKLNSSQTDEMSDLIKTAYNIKDEELDIPFSEINQKLKDPVLHAKSRLYKIVIAKNHK